MYGIYGVVGVACCQVISAWLGGEISSTMCCARCHLFEAKAALVDQLALWPAVAGSWRPLFEVGASFAQDVKLSAVTISFQVSDGDTYCALRASAFLLKPSCSRSMLLRRPEGPAIPAPLHVHTGTESGSWHRCSKLRYCSRNLMHLNFRIQKQQEWMRLGGWMSHCWPVKIHRLSA